MRQTCFRHARFTRPQDPVPIVISYTAHSSTASNHLPLRLTDRLMTKNKQPVFPTQVN
jgi:hypothetical protein